MLLRCVDRVYVDGVCVDRVCVDGVCDDGVCDDGVCVDRVRLGYLWRPAPSIAPRTRPPRSFCRWTSTRPSSWTCR